jgi:hypothetical protein
MNLSLRGLPKKKKSLLAFKRAKARSAASLFGERSAGRGERKQKYYLDSDGSAAHRNEHNEGRAIPHHRTKSLLGSDMTAALADAAALVAILLLFAVVLWARRIPSTSISTAGCRWRTGSIAPETWRRRAPCVPWMPRAGRATLR